MCLTEQAYRERKWGQFPVLRKAIEDKKIPGSYFGVTSASDNMFDAMGRLVEIAVLACEFEDCIIETANSTGNKEMSDDLIKLEKALESICSFFTERIKTIKRLSYTLEKKSFK